MKKTSILNMIEKKPAAAPSADTRPLGDIPPGTTMTGGDDERIRVVFRLNLEAVEALEDISKQLRRETGKAVPTQRLMEEAVSDLLRKYDRSAVVLPAPAKRGR